MFNRRVSHAAVAAVTAGVLMSGCNAWSDSTEADARAESTETTNSIAGRPSESVSQGAAISDDEIGLSKSGETYPGAPFIPELMTIDGLSDAEFDFYPCLEIPMEFFEELGLEVALKDATQEELEDYCLFYVPVEVGEATLNVRAAPYNSESFDAVPGETGWSAGGDNIPLITNRSEGLDGTGCTASVDTSGGSLSASYQMYFVERPVLDSCDQAAFWLTEILRLDGKIAH
ncbi:hypothetical protein ACG98H_06310 [Corynebacterium sp. L4756]|uniref:hypothetical protein n=1 Tax=unclassified Corynebacterium TaxID=2624378 RepID=UPI00374D67AC